MTVHDNVAVDLIVSETWAFKDFRECMSVTKVGHGHPNDCVCTTIRPDL